MVNFGNELCDVALAGENITNLKCLGLFCSLGNFFWVVYNDTGYIDIWVITLCGTQDCIIELEFGHTGYI